MEKRLYNGKWDGVWDKPKYQRIREKIWKAFEGIEFIEETHQYFYKGKELTPTSNVCHLFRMPFDEDMMAEQCERKYKTQEGHKYYGMSKDEIIDAWHAHSKKSTDHGTLIHLFGENCAYFMMRQYDRLTDDFKARIVKEKDGREYVKAEEPKEEGIVDFWNDLPVNIIPIVFEIQMFSLKYGISGTADLLFLHDPHIESDDNDKELMNRLYLMDYKGLSVDTPILTDKQWKTIGEVSVGDIVYDKDGRKTEVVNVSSVHTKPCYEIVFAEGDSIICDYDHRWPISFVSADDSCKYEEVMNTAEIYNYLKDENRNELLEMAIEVAKPIESTDNVTPDVLSKEIDLLSKDKYTSQVTPMTFSLDDKKKLLTVIMDKCGILKVKTYMIRVDITNKPMRDYVISLLSSMGIKPTIKKVINNLYISFNCDFNPFGKKKPRPSQMSHEGSHYKKIREIREIDTVPTKCIEVDSPSHTYLCGRNLLVTHNTNADLYKSFGNMMEPFNEMMDNDLGGYKIQAAIYSKFLEDIGFKFVSRALIWLRDYGNGHGGYEKVKMESLTNVLFEWLDAHPLKNILK